MSLVPHPIPVSRTFSLWKYATANSALGQTSPALVGAWTFHPKSSRGGRSADPRIIHHKAPSGAAHTQSHKATTHKAPTKSRKAPVQSDKALPPSQISSRSRRLCHSQSHMVSKLCRVISPKLVIHPGGRLSPTLQVQVVSFPPNVVDPGITKKGR